MNYFLLFNPKKQFWLSLLLSALCYGVFGWSFAASIPQWTSWLMEQCLMFNLTISANFITWGTKFLGIGFVMIMTFFLVAPLALIEFFLSNFFTSERKILFSVLLWAILISILICWFEFFVRLFVLFSAGILTRLDVQDLGCNKWQSFIILIIINITAFCIGLWSFS